MNGKFDYLKESTPHFSQMRGTVIVNDDGHSFGKLHDFFVDFEQVYPVVLGVQFVQNNRHFYIHWDDIKTFSLKKIVIKNAAEIRRGRAYPKIVKTASNHSILKSQYNEKTVDYPPLGKVILDRQIVDTAGKKVVRVNDIQFLKVGQFLRVTHAGVGIRSMVRRLGYESAVDFMVKLLKPKARYLKQDTLISWKFVHAIPDRTIHKNVKLNVMGNDY